MYVKTLEKGVPIMALKKPLNSFARARKVGHNSAKKQRQTAIAKLQQWAKGKSEELPVTK